MACLSGQHFPSDPFQVPDVGTPTPARGKRKRPLDQEGERGAPRATPMKQKRRASAGSTTPLQGVAHMAGSTYSYIGALVVGPWTSMAAYLAQPVQSPWRPFEGGRITRSVVKGQHREIEDVEMA